MADVSNLEPGQVLSFELNTKLLTSDYTTVKLQSICSAPMARRISDIDAIHANIISTLPEGTPQSPDEYNYLIVELIDGDVRAVGVPWIKDPVRVVNKTEINVTVKNVDVSDSEMIRKALNAYGYADIIIEVKE